MFLSVCVHVKVTHFRAGGSFRGCGIEIKDRVEEIKRSGRGEPIGMNQKGLLHPPDPCCVKEGNWTVTRQGPCGS